MQALLTRLLRLQEREALFARRGFHSAATQTRTHLEGIGCAFLRGYNAALDVALPTALASVLNAESPDVRGFAFEGAAMSITIQDAFTPWQQSRLQAFVSDVARDHIYVAYVGAGWAAARLPRLTRRAFATADPLLQWLIHDGTGFHDGYFHWRKYANGEPAPARLAGYARRAFDQGLGRSLWFSRGANPAAIMSTIERFSADRRSDLWSGVGLAATYAGGVSLADLEVFRGLAGGYASSLAQGAVFAAKARSRARIVSAAASDACMRLCHLTIAQASALADETLSQLATPIGPLSYEQWRTMIRERVATGSLAA